MSARYLLGFLLAIFALPVTAQVNIPICHGYSCLVEVDIRYNELQLARIRSALASTVNAQSEREMLAKVIGAMYRWAGQQSDIKNDRGGNYADAGVAGRMDCIDHATSTTRLLTLLENRGFLRWHRVLQPEVRQSMLFFSVHYSAAIEEKPLGNEMAKRFVVDSWFVDNGKPAVILPLEEWKKGAGPDV